VLPDYLTVPLRRAPEAETVADQLVLADWPRARCLSSGTLPNGYRVRAYSTPTGLVVLALDIGRGWCLFTPHPS
jgi:hypothetical protein